jgi:hypothetical protein
MLKTGEKQIGPAKKGIASSLVGLVRSAAFRGVQRLDYELGMIAAAVDGVDIEPETLKEAAQVDPQYRWFRQQLTAGGFDDHRNLPELPEGGFSRPRSIQARLAREKLILEAWSRSDRSEFDDTRQRIQTAVRRFPFR